MTSPIKQAHSLTPFWLKEIHRYDGLEVHPVRNMRWDDATQGTRPFHSSDDNETWCEPCDRAEAHFWSVYGHLKEGGIECFEDFPTQTLARVSADQLLEIFPHLREEDDATG